MQYGKPIIGIVGGIGSGKSFIADLFGELGCLVIKSDDQVRDVYRSDEVKRILREWWGDAVFDPDGQVNRKAIAKRVFADPTERQRLEQLIHPRVAQARDEAMKHGANDPQVVAFVWDTPLLLEVGLSDNCDAIVFVDAPLEVRVSRVQQTRGWDAAELLRRENSQMPLDKKREMSDYVIVNTADAGSARIQVRDVLSRILARPQRTPVQG